MKISDEQHARILSAYLNRLTRSDLEAVCAAQYEAHQASLLYGTGSQIKAQQEADQAISKAVSHMIAHDKWLVQDVIEAVVS